MRSNAPIEDALQEWAEERSWLQSLLEKSAEDVRREQVRLSQRIENAMQEEAG